MCFPSCPLGPQGPAFTLPNHWAHVPSTGRSPVPEDKAIIPQRGRTQKASCSPFQNLLWALATSPEFQTTDWLDPPVPLRLSAHLCSQALWPVSLQGPAPSRRPRCPPRPVPGLSEQTQCFQPQDDGRGSRAGPTDVCWGQGGTCSQVLTGLGDTRAMSRRKGPAVLFPGSSGSTLRRSSN